MAKIEMKILADDRADLVATLKDLYSDFAGELVTYDGVKVATTGKASVDLDVETSGTPTSVETPNFPAHITDDEEVDTEGIPWDERIHASTKTKTVKGVWKRLRGVDDITFNEVMEELKPPCGTKAPAVTETPMPTQAPAATETPMPTQAPADGGMYNLVTLMSKVHELKQAGKVTDNYLQTLSTHFGVPSFGEITKYPDVFKPFIETLNQIG